MESITWVFRKYFGSTHEFSENFTETVYILKSKIQNAYMEEYHLGVNSYWIGIGKFQSESEKLMCKRLNSKKGEIEIFANV